MDPFKNYLQHNRKALDVDEPLKIQWTNKNSHRKSNSLFFLKPIAVAAIVFITFFLAMLLINQTHNFYTGEPSVSENSKPVTTNTEPKDLTPKQDLKIAVKQPINNRHAHKNRQAALKKQLTQPTILAIEENHQLQFYAAMQQHFEKQILAVTSTAVYAETPLFFSVFFNEWKKLSRLEENLKKSVATSADTASFYHLTTLYKQKKDLLNDLLFAIENINSKALHLNVMNKEPYYLQLNL